jgi:DNA-directed RNA polymerase subunit RPC12/RpoP
MQIECFSERRKFAEGLRQVNCPAVDHFGSHCRHRRLIRARFDAERIIRALRHVRAVAAFNRPLRDRDRRWNAPLLCAACAAPMTSFGMIRMITLAGNKGRPSKRAAPKERPLTLSVP